MQVPFKLLICASDKPGSLLTMLRELSGEKFTQVNIDVNPGTVYEPNLHMFTFKRCERFTPIYSQDVYTGSVILMRPKYTFHFIIELQAQDKEKDRQENSSKESSTSKIDKIAVMEVHVCINAHYYGIDVNIFKKIIEAFSAPRCSRGDNEWVFCPKHMLQNIVKKDIINYGLLMFPSKADKKAINIISKFNRILSGLLNRNNDNRCVFRSTCPIAHVRINEEKFKELYGKGAMRYHILKPLSNNSGEGIDGIEKIYITFARDHECYESDKTFAEYYGIIEENHNDSTSDLGYEEDGGLEGNVINAIIICPHFIKNEASNILEKYIDSVVNKLKDNGVITKDYLKYPKQGKEIGINECFYIYSKYFTCDDPRCELVQESLPTITLSYQ